MSDLVLKTWKATQWIIAIVGIIGFGGVGFQIWQLSEVVGNGKEIRDSKIEMINLINQKENEILDKINKFSIDLGKINAALGESPGIIQKAAIKIQNASSTIDYLEKSGQCSL